MEELHSLIRSMSSAEKRIMRSYFSAFSSRNESDTLFLRMFNYLEGAEKAPDDEETSLYLYGKAANGTFRSHKSRFKDKLLDALNMDVNIERKDQLEDLNYASVMVRKRLSLFYQLYHTRGNHPIVRSLLNSILALAREYEIYSVVSDCLVWKKTLRGFVSG